MTKLGLTSLAAVFLTCFACGIHPVLASGCGFSLAGTDEKRIVVGFELPPWELDPVDVSGVPLTRIRTGCAEDILKAGFPVLPQYKAVVALPPGSAVSSRWNPGNTLRMRAGRIMPAQPAGQGTGDEFNFPPSVTEYSSELASAGSYPEDRVLVLGPKRFRDLLITEILVRPFIYEPSSNTLLVTVSFEVTIDISPQASFQGGFSGRYSEKIYEDLYRDVLLNYESSTGWRIPSEDSPTLAATPFSDGEAWVSLRVPESDMYAVSGESIAHAGVDLGSINPASLRLYRGSGRMLSENPEVPDPILTDVAVYLTGLEDGSFDSRDRLIFYGEGLDRFTASVTGTISSIRHRYGNHAVYWLTWGGSRADGLRMTELNQPVPSGTTPLTSAEFWYHLEENTEYLSLRLPNGDNYNPAPDYWAWVLDSDAGGIVERNFDLGRLPEAEGNYLRYEFYNTGSAGELDYKLFFNGAQFPGGRIKPYVTVISDWIAIPSGFLQMEGNRFTLSGQKLALGFIELRARTALTLGSGERVIFHEADFTINPAYEFNAVTATSVQAFDLTLPDKPVLLEVEHPAAGVFRFAAPVSSYKVRSFAAVADGAFREPDEIRLEQPVNLRSRSGAEYLIITSRALAPQARNLENFRAAEYSTAVVTIEDIYNEFSLGPADPVALRNFLRYTFNYWPIRPRFAVLFGDGHNDFRGVTAQGHAKVNHILPYITSGDIAVEEWFARFDNSDLPQLSLGRIPVSRASEASVVVDKIIKYSSGAEAGDWTRRLILVADDGYTSGRQCDHVTNHVPGSEELDSLFPADFVRRKVYLDSYPFDPPEIGTRKPAANEDLIAWWNRGALVINYLGHGSELTWAQERVWDTERDLALLNNGYRLPLVLNSSCSIGRFDDYLDQAMAERLLSFKGGGAEVVFAGTRVTFAFQNVALNKLFVKYLFNQESRPVGLAHLAARLGLGGLDRGNAERYSIFGDPALKLHTPGKKLKIELAPHVELKAGAKVDFTGRVEDRADNPETSFSGLAQVKFLGVGRPVDISYQCRTAGGLLERTVSFERTPVVLFDGPVTISGGSFSGSFVLPANLAGSIPSDTMDLGSGMFIGYATSELTDAAGASRETPFLAGIQSLADTSVPKIRVFSQGRELVDGDRVSGSRRLELVISDESGINTTGRPGEQLTVEVDDGLTWSADLTPLFSYRRDSYQEGTVELDLSKAGEALHSFRFRATDNALNTARIELMLYVVADGGELTLSNVINYPNPFSEETAICYEISAPADVLIRIFSVAGRPVRELRSYGLPAGFHSTSWDGRDEYQQKIANGVYLYKIICKSINASGKEEVEAVGKALLSR